MIAATGKIIWPVEESCIVLAVERQLQRQRLRIGNRVGRGDAGPNGQKLSCHLPCSQSKKPSLSRVLAVRIGAELAVEMSLTTVYPATQRQGVGLLDAFGNAADHHAQLHSQSMWSGEHGRNEDRRAGVGQRVVGGFMKT